MKSTLKKGQRCPLHDSYFCCGRASRFQRTQQKQQTRFSRPATGWKAKAEYIGRGVWKILDPSHPRGFRERRNKSALAELLNLKIVEQDKLCALCGERFDDYRLIVAEHKDPKGMGGARRDDHPDNIQAAHNWPCNAEKGSKRIA